MKAASRFITVVAVLLLPRIAFAQNIQREKI
jgi:hypothetical protein